MPKKNFIPKKDFAKGSITQQRLFYNYFFKYLLNQAMYRSKRSF
jgi:hypothetical protein